MTGRELRSRPHLEQGRRRGLSRMSPAFGHDLVALQVPGVHSQLRPPGPSIRGPPEAS